LHEAHPFLGRRARKYFGKLPDERAAPKDCSLACWELSSFAGFRRWRKLSCSVRDID